MQILDLKPTHKAVKDYYAALQRFGQMRFDHEGAVSQPFAVLLDHYARKLEWKLVPQYEMKPRGHRIVIDGAVLDFWTNRRGFWEAKDEHDDLESEIKKKIEKGYPTSNMIFQAPERAILYQHGVRQGLNEDIRDAKNLATLLTEFFGYRQPDYEEWDEAVAEFEERIPELAAKAKEIIDAERKGNARFRESFEAFYGVCRQSINPNLSTDAVEEMLIQHLLTERIFRRVFHNEEFRSRNVIAAEIEKVIGSLTSRHFSRDEFLSGLDHFYKAIERAADDKADYSEKQAFLNRVYQEFFKGYSPKEADVYGIVYTPQAIVDFMVRSVDDILKKEFGKTLGLADKGVHILDPFVGTGNFIVRVMRQIAETRKSALAYKYAEELHCNEVMLLPYYIASMNIEHEYAAQIGEYKPFDGICLVDTFELAEPEQGGFPFMSEENTARVQKQKRAPIFVVIGNPPYNMGQVNENDDNKNRKYKALDTHVRETYAHASTATLLTKLSDPYVRAFRWATDRVVRDGIIAFVTNSSFLTGRAFDGMRHHLLRDFDRIYVLDLGGDVRKNPKLSGTTHNVFGIQVGVSINLLIRNSAAGPRDCAKVLYSSVDQWWRKEQKYAYLDAHADVQEVEWRPLVPDGDTWLSEGLATEYSAFLALSGANGIFKVYSPGINTARDRIAYSFDAAAVAKQVQQFLELYNTQVLRYVNHGKPKDLKPFLDPAVNWSRNLKRHLRHGTTFEFDQFAVRDAVYRPYVSQKLYWRVGVVDELGKSKKVVSETAGALDNRLICVTAPGSSKPFHALMAAGLADFHVVGDSQCFPLRVSDKKSSKQGENITNWALNEFRTHYKDKKITKWDIFHYCYAVLHHPEYRTRYAANLKRELPRIPFVKPNAEDAEDAEVFRSFVNAGRKLADLHVNYEKQPEYELEHKENPNEIPNYRVEKMRLGKDKTSLVYNSFLMLSGIPPETYEYRLGNRSALEWVVDQYQVSTDKRSGITNDPNRADDDQYILRLIGQVVHVSIETVKIVKALPSLGLPKEVKAAVTGSKD